MGCLIWNIHLGFITDCWIFFSTNFIIQYSLYSQEFIFIHNCFSLLFQNNLSPPKGCVSRTQVVHSGPQPFWMQPQHRIKEFSWCLTRLTHRFPAFKTPFGVQDPQGSTQICWYDKPATVPQVFLIPTPMKNTGSCLVTAVRYILVIQYGFTVGAGQPWEWCWALGGDIGSHHSRCHFHGQVNAPQSLYSCLYDRHTSAALYSRFFHVTLWPLANVLVNEWFIICWGMYIKQCVITLQSLLLAQKLRVIFL